MQSVETLTANRAKFESEIQSYQEKITQCEATLSKPGAEHSPAKSEIEFNIISSRSRIKALKHNIDMIDRDLSWHERKQGTPGLMNTYHEKLHSWAADKVELLEKRQALSTRLEETKAQTSKQLSEARLAEEEAARSYAQAVAWGDVDAEKTASTAAQKAAKALEAAQEHQRRQGLIINALEKEIQIVDEHIDEADREYAKIERNAVLLATERLEEEWDAAAQALIDLGAKLYAGLRYMGREQMAFHDLKIPGRVNLYQKWDQGNLMGGATQFGPNELIGLSADTESETDLAA